jgi:uncharacterized Rmd1/YagE family protein
MFTMEYMKLMETNNERFPDNHYASLEKLSTAILKENGILFQEKHNMNLEVLQTIKG